MMTDYTKKLFAVTVFLIYMTALRAFLTINNIGGLVVQAIREKWEPSVSLQKPTHSQNNIDLTINTSYLPNQNRETISLEELAEISNIFMDKPNG